MAFPTVLAGRGILPPLAIPAGPGSPRPLAASLLVCWLLACCLLVISGGCGVNSKQQNASGVGLYQQGFYPGAMQKFQQAIYNDPTNADGYYNMAATLHKQGRINQSTAELEQAESYYNQCLDHSPDHRDCYRGLAVLLSEQGRSEEAFRLMEGWAQRSPSLADPKIELARLFQEYGEKGPAQEHLLEALTVEPNNSRALAALGRLREETGNQAQALAVYQRSLMYNRYQPQVAQRVAALQPAFGQQMTAPPMVGGSRTVNATQPSFR